ncbi:glyoxylate/hydroxypyruvate reductase A [Paracoccus sp. Z330]|uniref:Glyoxylate/hydroxypyruvate reductase A n=1 Tax=Paracoccus onchidii TaxID=3017813 RepID=A0ABT4ZBG8_9RHOB|nr:glyoxylate/hydroxypyruvate reductase A [Paracoccus onchidii]MDB6176492.1 glyoxylate/hydroxypyruvate reductase A [Paracoccus onchidii]
MKVLFAAPDDVKSLWTDTLIAACPEMDLQEAGDPAQFDAIIYCPGGEIEDLSPYRNARLVQSLWAGVESIIDNPTLTQPLARMVDPGLAKGMAEFCTGWAMRAHLQMDRYRQDGIWRGSDAPPLADARAVTIMGMGALGQAVAAMLRPIGFDLAGYSASGRAVEGVRVYDRHGLGQALSRAEILICLLPDTAETRNLLNEETLAMLPEGAWIINAGRGTLIDEAALLAALERGHLGHAVLDVFRKEPVARNNPFWDAPGVTITPHIAAATRPETAALVVAENLRRAMAGQPVLHLVDRSRGY